MAFQQLAGVAFTLRAESTFSLCELAAEKFRMTAHKAKM